MDMLDMDNNGEVCQSPLTLTGSTVAIIVSCVLGLIWAIRNVFKVKEVDLSDDD